MAHQVGPNGKVHPDARVTASVLGSYCEVGARTRIRGSRLGRYTYVRENADIAYSDVGSFCSIAPAVCINPAPHPLDRPSQHHFSYRSSQYGIGPDDEAYLESRRSQRVRIGHDVWIGHGAVILTEVTVGSGAVIGAASIVTRDVEPYVIVAGNPARHIRYRIDEALVESMLGIAWWNWPDEFIRSALDDFRDLPLREFIAKHSPPRGAGGT